MTEKGIPDVPPLPQEPGGQMEDFIYYGQADFRSRRNRKELPDTPPFDVHILYAPHATAEHLTGFKDCSQKNRRWILTNRN